MGASDAGCGAGRVRRGGRGKPTKGRTAAVHLAHLRLRNFRNYPRLDADWSPGFHVLAGANAQGKTNLLEAIYLLATLRSFRGIGGAQMIQQGQAGYFVGARIVGVEQHDVRIYWSVSRRELTLDRHPVRRIADYLGVLRAVVFCSEDSQLVKGSGRIRRRFLDLILTQTQPDYLAWLQRYHTALRARNAILKGREIDPDALAGFSAELVRAGKPLMEARESLTPRLAEVARGAYERMAGVGRESLAVTYEPNVRGDLAVALAQSRARDQAYRQTMAGPHRDELRLALDGRPAAQYGSEGQKRTVALALKAAQAEYLTLQHGTPPVLLIDDVMGELDRQRRGGFIPLLEQVRQARSQVFMTCTEENWPRDLGTDLVRWTVTAGDVRPG